MQHEGTNAVKTAEVMYCICRFEGSGIWTRECKATAVHVQLLKKKAENEPQPLTKQNRPASQTNGPCKNHPLKSV